MNVINCVATGMNADNQFQNFALGWGLNQSYSSKHFKNGIVTRMVHHAGVNKGAMNFLCLFPKANIVINVSTNGRSEDIDFSHFWNFTMKVVSPFVERLQDESGHSYKKFLP
jgi:serine beta-lactamase-like protein LACTB, mitochondrial